MMAKKGSFLEGVEQFLGNFQAAAARTDFDVRLGNTVEIASTGYQQVQPLGQVEVFRRLALRVRTVVDFNAAEAVGFQGR